MGSWRVNASFFTKFLRIFILTVGSIREEVHGLTNSLNLFNKIICSESLVAENHYFIMFISFVHRFLTSPTTYYQKAQMMTYVVSSNVCQSNLMECAY